MIISTAEVFLQPLIFMMEVNYYLNNHSIIFNIKVRKIYQRNPLNYSQNRVGQVLIE